MPWFSNGTSANVEGASAEGEVKREDGAIHLTGRLRDRADDGKSAMLLIDVDQGASVRKFDEHTHGPHTETSIGGDGGYSFSEEIKSISVTECLTDPKKEGNSKIEVCGSQPHQIWPRP